MEINEISSILTYVYIYSFLGWVLESVYKSILQKKFVNSGFIIGPFCPIYGLAAIMLCFFLEGLKNNFVFVFVISVIAFSVWEYLVGYLLEKMFNTKYWDYSEEKFNYKGRICLKASLIWGLLGTLFIYVLHPFISELVQKISIDILNPIVALLLLYIIIDFIISALKVKNIDIKLLKLTEIQQNIALKINEIKSLSLKTIQLEDLKALANKSMQLDSLKKTLEELKENEQKLKNKLNRKIVRLKEAFPTMKSQKITEFLNQKMESIKKEKKER